MIQDANLRFSVAQALTAQGDVVSTNSVDTRVAESQSHGMTWLRVFVGDLFTSNGAATLIVELQDSADDASFADARIRTFVIALGTLVAGYSILQIPLPVGLRRYLQLSYNIAGADFTAGTINADLGLSPVVTG